MVWKWNPGPHIYKANSLMTKLSLYPLLSQFCLFVFKNLMWVIAQELYGQSQLEKFLLGGDQCYGYCLMSMFLVTHIEGLYDFKEVLLIQLKWVEIIHNGKDCGKPSLLQEDSKQVNSWRKYCFFFFLKRIKHSYSRTKSFKIGV